MPASNDREARANCISSVKLHVARRRDAGQRATRGARGARMSWRGVLLLQHDDLVIEDRIDRDRGDAAIARSAIDPHPPLDA
jgi:hypothetical protein